MKSKLLAFLFLTMFVVSCKESAYFTKGLDGPQGPTGQTGQNGTSCSVSTEYDSESEAVLGARISCTDGSFSLVLNGTQGGQGIQGPQGGQGIQGPSGPSCQAYRSIFFHGVWLACPHQLPVLIADGEDGQDGHNGHNGSNGTSCSVSQLSSGVKVTCGSHSAYVWNGVNGTNGSNGSNGTNGTSCTVVRESNRAKITCGSQYAYVYDGEDGEDGHDGEDGDDGEDGEDGEDGSGGATILTFNPTTSCSAVGAVASAKRDGSSSNIKLYSGTSCSGSSTTLGDGDSAMTSLNELVVKVQGAATLKLISF